ncbi:hypothetical protein ALC62_03232 [Cyphomyrmex costatus]|uniref:DDE Tnp4 domain-containing protein n=1 Tax=Cyphomyrmex costatus TaxID=456900 RepID=A0A151K2E4_9HYME|nr:hypothetical protein ALC62_03232 [Cyphomyrmex costatus]
MAIERAIGSLKMRFRILLDCLPLTDIKKVPEFILACCVLYNICLLQNDEMPMGIQFAYNEDVDFNGHGNAVELGKEKRNRIMNALQMKI